MKSAAPRQGGIAFAPGNGDLFVSITALPAMSARPIADNTFRRMGFCGAWNLPTASREPASNSQNRIGSKKKVEIGQ